MGKVQLAAAFALAVLGHMPAAFCSEDAYGQKTAGAWTAAFDWSAFKVYADAVSGGRLAFVLPLQAHHFMIQATKPSWHLAQGTKVPLSVSFATGSSFILSGVGSGGEIDAPVPDADVAAWTHNFTALSEMTVGFPAAIESASWTISLSGTTPTIEAMAHAIEVTPGMTDLPKPFNLVPPTFPGAASFPVAQDDELYLTMRLFNATTADSITWSGGGVCERDPPCRVQPLQDGIWPGSDGKQRAIITIGAEPSSQSHAEPAVLGIAVLRDEKDGWMLEAGSPMVDQIGEFGTIPNVEVFNAGKSFGVVAYPHGGGQGYFNYQAYFYVLSDGQIRKVLEVHSAEDDSGACNGDAICLRNDFTSDLSVVDMPDGLDVIQTITGQSPAYPGPAGKRWHISLAGDSREVSPWKPTPEEVGRQRHLTPTERDIPGPMENANTEQSVPQAPQTTNPVPQATNAVAEQPSYVPGAVMSCGDFTALMQSGNTKPIYDYATDIYMRLDAARIASGKRAIGIPFTGWTSSFLNYWSSFCSIPSVPFYSAVLAGYNSAVAVDQMGGN